MCGPQLFSHALRKKLTAAPVPFRKSSQIFNVCNRHLVTSYGLNTGI